MNQKFNLGDLVKIIGVIESVTLFSEGVYYYNIGLEGTQPFDYSTCYLNEKAIRKCNKEELEFFKNRKKKSNAETPILRP